MDTEIFLQENQENLNNILRPFQQELNRGQRLADFLKQCVRCLGRDDFLQLEELLSSKTAQNVEDEEALNECRPLFQTLREYTSEQVEKYRFAFIEDLSRLAEEAELPIEIDFPRFMCIIRIAKGGLVGRMTVGRQRINPRLPLIPTWVLAPGI